MKSYEFLEMAIDCGVNSRAMGMVTIRKQKDVESLFETKHDRKVERGRYAYIRTDEISDNQFGEMENAVDDIIMTDELDERHQEEEPGQTVWFMLFKIDDYPQEFIR